MEHLIRGLQLVYEACGLNRCGYQCFLVLLLTVSFVAAYDSHASVVGAILPASMIRELLDVHSAILACAITAAVLSAFALRGYIAPEDSSKFSSQSSEESSEFSFLLGVPEPSFLQASGDQMAWLEDRVRELYSGDKWPTVNFRESLHKLREAIRPLQRKDWRLREPFDDIMLCRWLIARDFDVAKCTELAQQYLHFRAETRGGVRVPSDWLASGAVIVPFEDRIGRPVVVVRAKYLDACMSQQALESGYRATLDALSAHMLSARGFRMSEGNPLEQYIVVVDINGVGWRNWSSSILRMMIRESHSHYPERLAKVIILGCSHFASATWRMTAPMLHPRTVNKVSLITQEEVAGYMPSVVDARWLPPEYGGEALSWVEPELASTLHDKAGRLAANIWLRLKIAPRGSDDISFRKVASQQCQQGTFCCGARVW